jgi:predicted CoA-binding protein
MNPDDDDDALRSILLAARRVALVGASDRPDRPSFGVMRFLLDRGCEVVPVNPRLAGREVHGRAAVATLAGAAPLGLVDIFRRPAEAAAAVEEAAALGAAAVWLQLGVTVPAEVAARARVRGVRVVMDRCPAIEWRRLGLPNRLPAAVA